MCYSTNDFTHRYDIKSYSQPTPKKPNKMIKEVKGYQVEGVSTVFETLEEAEKLANKISKRNRYQELVDEFKHTGDLVGYLKSGLCDIDDFTSKLKEFMTIRKEILEEQEAVRLNQ